MKILIVEDDKAGRILMERYLRDYGSCYSVEDGKEALEMYLNALEAGEPYHLVILDIMLPSMDGQEILRNIRLEEKKRGIRPADFIKVIMTTALSDPKNVVRAFSEGSADSYLVKPVEKETLEEELKKLGFYGDE
ncbi:MAG: response regulator transcription factor [Spirochaetaceae bacterium]